MQTFHECYSEIRRWIWSLQFKLIFSIWMYLPKSTPTFSEQDFRNIAKDWSICFIVIFQSEEKKLILDKKKTLVEVKLQRMSHLQDLQLHLRHWYNSKQLLQLNIWHKNYVLTFSLRIVLFLILQNSRNKVLKEIVFSRNEVLEYDRFWFYFERNCASWSLLVCTTLLFWRRSVSRLEAPIR